MPLLFERGGPSKFTMVSVNYSYIEVKAWAFLPVLLCPAFSLCSGMPADNASYSINHRTVTEQEKAGQRPSGGKMYPQLVHPNSGISSIVQSFLRLSATSFYPSVIFFYHMKGGQ